jgi:hypothetical protein
MTRYFFRRIGRSQNGVGPLRLPWPFCGIWPLWAGWVGWAGWALWPGGLAGACPPLPDPPQEPDDLGAGPEY